MYNKNFDTAPNTNITPRDVSRALRRKRFGNFCARHYGIMILALVLAALMIVSVGCQMAEDFKGGLAHITGTETEPPTMFTPTVTPEPVNVPESKPVAVLMEEVAAEPTADPHIVPMPQYSEQEVSTLYAKRIDGVPDTLYTRKLANVGKYIGEKQYYTTPIEYYDMAQTEYRDVLTACQNSSAYGWNFSQDGGYAAYKEQMAKCLPLDIPDFANACHQEYEQKIKDNEEHVGTGWTDASLMYLDGDGYIRARGLEFVKYDTAKNPNITEPKGVWLATECEYIVTYTTEAAEVIGVSPWTSDKYTVIEVIQTENEWHEATPRELALIGL